MIELYQVTKRYPGGQVGLRDVSLQIPKGQLVFLTGPSGAGKTTFLKLIYREETTTEGSILVNGRNVTSLPRRKVPYLRRTIGVVFQNFRLIPRKTVYENVSYLPRILGLDSRAQRKVAYDTLRRVGLAHRLKAFPRQLSGGEQQRVAIARALINQPDILLADEPTGNLDPELSEEILRLFLEINLEGTTVIFATHDRGLIRRVGRRVLTLEDGALVDDRHLPGEMVPEGVEVRRRRRRRERALEDENETRRAGSKGREPRPVPEPGADAAREALEPVTLEPAPVEPAPVEPTEGP